MRPITATVDLAALRHNLAVVRQHAVRARAFAVVKANAYGHGLARAVRAFSGADGLALVELDAAVRLREAGYRGRIALLEGFFEPAELPVIARHRLAVVVHCTEQIDMLAALPAGSALDVLVKLNSGMNRLGLEPGRLPAALERLREHPGVECITLATHFANADDARGVDWQLERFERCAGAQPFPRSLANSAAILRYPHTHADWVRPGIMLYGCSPFGGQVGRDLGLKPAMTLAAEIIAVRELARGETVGYGGAYMAARTVRVGVVACGYADGYPRHAPTGTPVLVGERLSHTIGRVSMDMLCVDLTGCEGAGVGTRVVLWGAGNPVERVAEAAGTVGYELLCALAPRVPVMEQA